MSAKTSPARIAAFLRAVRETGNQTVAAERAKVSRGWVQLHRSTDPAFRAALDAAVAAAKERLDGASRLAPDRRWRTQDGEELCVRGTNGRWTQVARARQKQWTPRTEAHFLAHLAATCNVKAACAAVGLSAPGAYAHRRRWPGFAQRWDEAVEEGYDRLATAIVAAAGRMLGDPDMVPEVAVTGIGFGDAIRLLGQHRARAHGEGRLRARRPVLDDATRAAIIKRLEPIERAIQARMTPDQRLARQAELATMTMRARAQPTCGR